MQQQHCGAVDPEELAAANTMAEVGRALLHQAARCGLGCVVDLLRQRLMAPPFERSFDWLVAAKRQVGLTAQLDRWF